MQMGFSNMLRLRTYMNLKYAGALAEWQNEAALKRKAEEDANFHGKMPDVHLEKDADITRK